MNLEPLSEKIKAFNFRVIEIDGNDMHPNECSAFTIKSANPGRILFENFV